MSYTVTTNYDSRMPSWPGNGTPFTLVACHDTEGGQGRAGALGTIQFLINTPERGASYHELWWYHESTDEFGVIRIVQPFRAAGSIGPQQPPTGAYQPSAWVRSALGTRWYDPNQGVYAVSIAGRVADVDRYAKNPKFLAHAHRRMMELWREFGITKRAEHSQFQPSNRTDWGRTLMTALGGLVTKDTYEPPTTSAPETSMNITPITPTRMTIRPETSIRKLPDLTAASFPWVVGKVAVVTVIGQINSVDFGAGPVWYAYVINTGGLRFFHSSDVTAKVALVQPDDSAAQIEDLRTEVATLTTKANTLTATVETQTGVIAGLRTELGEVQVALAAKRAELAEAIEAKAHAEAAAAEATTAAGNAVALREALQNFLS